MEKDYINVFDIADSGNYDAIKCLDHVCEDMDGSYTDVYRYDEYVQGTQRQFLIDDILRFSSDEKPAEKLEQGKYYIESAELVDSEEIDDDCQFTVIDDDGKGELLEIVVDSFTDEPLHKYYFGGEVRDRYFQRMDYYETGEAKLDFLDNLEIVYSLKHNDLVPLHEVDIWE